MIYFYSILLGVVQALTEFLPISSSGHLALLHEFLKFNLEDNVAFDVALHLGTGLAILFFFRKEIKKYLVAVINAALPKKKVDNTDLKVALNIFYATIPAAILGVLFEDAIEQQLRSPWVIVTTLLVGAVLFLLIERFGEKDREYTGLGFLRSLYLGFAQSLALIPGLSRSGITIVAGMSLKLKRADAAKFSFLIGLPTILGAGLVKMLKLDWTSLGLENILVFVLGFLVSGLLGLFVIKFLLKYLEGHKLNIFAYYRIALAVILILILVLK